MKNYYLSIKNIDTTVLNYCGPKDKTASLLKVSGEITDLIKEKAVFIVEDGILIKRNGRYPAGEIGQPVSSENMLLMENNYSKTTTKQFDTFDKIEAIMVK